MPDSINYAEKYSAKVDEYLAAGTYTASIINNDFDWLGVEAVTVLSRDLAQIGDYALDGGMSRYGTPAELGNKKQTMTLSQDRSATWIIDKKSNQDTNGVMAAGASLAEFINLRLIPEVDKYRITKLCAGVPATGTYSGRSHAITEAVDKANAYEEFLNGAELFDEDARLSAGAIALVTPKFGNLLKQDENFTKKGDLATKMAINGLIGAVDAFPVIRVPSNYFPANVDYVITHPMVLTSPVKLYEYRIHENPPGVSGWLVEVRMRYDAFVLNNKKDCIIVHKHA